MSALLLHEFHAARGASFTFFNGFEAAASYGRPGDEYRFLTGAAALIDLSFRGRLCLLGADREKFLHGQVTNDILRLKAGQGCYAALVSTKAKMESDLFVYKLAEELLLDFEPGLTGRISDRLNRFIIAEDVQVVDVAPHYGLLHLAGPRAGELLRRADYATPEEPLSWKSISTEQGEVYLINNPRYGVPGFDLFAPLAFLPEMAQKLDALVNGAGGGWAGWDAVETVRIENAIPRFGADMTESTIPQEAELQAKAISFAKGCYIGQEIIARIRTYGQVAKALRLLRLPPGQLPAPGASISVEGKPVGSITSATQSVKYGAPVALGYVRKEHFAPGTKVRVGPDLAEAEILGPAWG